MATAAPLDRLAWDRYIRGEYAPDRLPPEAEPADEGPGGAFLRRAIDLCLGCHRSVPEGQAREYTQFSDGRRRREGRFAIGRIVRPLEERALTEWATSASCLMDDAFLTQRWVEQGRMGGAEHEVYFEPDTQRWFKRNNLTYHTTYLEYFHRLVLHNIFFPEAAVRLEGLTCSPELLMPVLSQPHVVVARGAARAETEAAMLLLGLERQQDDNYYSATAGVIAEDLHDENVVIGEDGELYVIDPALYLDERGKGQRLRLRTEGRA